MMEELKKKVNEVYNIVNLSKFHSYFEDRV